MSIVSGTIGAITQANSANKATNAQKDAAKDSITLQKEMYDTARADYAPYMQAGTNALYALQGYQPQTTTTKQQIEGTGRYVTDMVPTGGGWSQVGHGSDEGGSVYTQPVNTEVQRWVPAEYRDSTQTTYAPTGTPMDPTGGADQYKAQLENFNPTFNAEDPTYKWQQEQLEKAVNRALSARGLYDSRAGVNALSDSNRALIATEADKQYNRQYGNLTDLYNMSMNSGKTKYGAAYDIARLGAGAASGGATSALASGQGISSSYNALGNAIASGQNANSAITQSYLNGIQSTPFNALAAYNMGSKLWGGMGTGASASGANFLNSNAATGLGASDAYLFA
jgi:hypothetical protein